MPIDRARTSPDGRLLRARLFLDVGQERRRTHGAVTIDLTDFTPQANDLLIVAFAREHYDGDADADADGAWLRSPSTTSEKALPVLA